MGNPLSYRDGMTFAWENGRQLDTITKSNNTLEFKYNSNGMRTQKTDDDYTTNYYYDSNSNLVGLNLAGSTLFFYYDSDGNVTSFSNNDTMYYYVKDLQGDIVKIIDESGNTKVTYTYDAWGKVLSQTDTSIYNLANLNPFRYRGYVYDSETGLYYLQSRYYDPITGRFLNADAYADTGNSVLSTNMFSYCENNAVMKIDANGEDAWWLQDSSAVYTMGHTSLLIQEKKGHWWYFYWEDKSIKLIYVGTCSLWSLNLFLWTHCQTYKNKNNKYVNELIYTGYYNKRICFKGNFYNSFKYIYYTLMGQSGSIKSIGIYYYNSNPSYDLWKKIVCK